MKGQMWVEAGLESSSHGEKTTPCLLEGWSRGSVPRTQRELESWRKFPGRNGDPGGDLPDRGRGCGEKALVFTLLFLLVS